MARRRVIDWKKVRAFLRKRGFLLRRKRKPLGWPVSLTWFGILACADDFGMGEWSVTDIAMHFMEKELAADEINLREVGEIMETFTRGEDPSVITWEHDGRTLFVLPKHQNYQNVHSPQNADTPFPPRDVFTKLSPRMRRHFNKNFTKFTTFCDPLFRPEVEVEIEVEVEGEEEGADSRGCPFCRKPTKGPLQHYHDEAKRVLGRCLMIDPKFCGPMISRREHILGRERCHKLFGVYLASEDQFVEKNGHSLSLFCSEKMQNGLAAALDGGFVHGSRDHKTTKPVSAAKGWNRNG